MIILGIDPGLATTGYGVIEKINDLKLIDYGIISSPKDEMTSVRLAMIYKEMEKLLKEFKPDHIAIEELFFNTNTTTAIKVAQARGVVLLSSILYTGNLFEYTPLQIKMALTGQGRADKKQVQFMVKTILLLNEIPKPDDSADALAVAICHANTPNYKKREHK